jgi:hypothetical protein
MSGLVEQAVVVSIVINIRTAVDAFMNQLESKRMELTLALARTINAQHTLPVCPEFNHASIRIQRDSKQVQNEFELITSQIIE